MGWSQFRKTGLTHHERSKSIKGYTLVSPLSGDSTFLVDMDGLVVHRWRFEGFRVFKPELLPNGNLLMLCNDASIPVPTPPPGTVIPFEQNLRRLGGACTHLLEVDWDGNLVWEYCNHAIHHDFVRLPNGNTLLPEDVELPPELAREVRGGIREKTPPLLSDDFIEIDAKGKEVRRVHLWKLLDPRRDPICSLERRLEWTHTNSLDVTPEGGIVFSCRVNSRVGIIDASGERLLWKYGFPDISHQHHASVLRNGNIQIFDNGMHRQGQPRSAVVEVDPKTNQTVWQFVGTPEAQFFSGHISGAQRLRGENVLVTEGTPGSVFEVTRQGEVVWEWISPFTNYDAARNQALGWLFRSLRYEADYPGLAGRELDPARYRELNRAHGLSE